MNFFRHIIERIKPSWRTRHAMRPHKRHKPAIITRAEHHISRKEISRNALKVLYRLSNAGYEAYLVGGGVRDLLLGGHPKDFDVATNATPEEINRLFRNCRLIGRRFRLAHIHFGREIIEVATFRAQHDDKHADAQKSDSGMIIRDNVYGTLEDDAWRRDFTINALYYNIRDFSVVDYTGGMKDLRNRTLRMIGNPKERYIEDPVRLLRIIRFAGKLDLQIEDKTKAPIHKLSQHLSEVPSARLFEEVRKLYTNGAALKSHQLLEEFGLFEKLFPATYQAVNDPDIGDVTEKLVQLMLTSTDTRIQQGKPVTPAFFYAAMLWVPLRAKAKALENKGVRPYQALQQASEAILSEQIRTIAIPKRISIPIKEIWMLQFRLVQRMGNRAFQLLESPRFRAGYDLLVLRSQAGEKTKSLADWWHSFQEMDEDKRQQMVQQLERKVRRGGRYGPRRPR